MSVSSISSTSKSLYPKSIRIGLIDPNIAQTWAQRILSDGTTVASIKKGDTINHTTSQPIATGLFCQRIFGPCIDYTCACGHEKIRIHRNVNVSPPVCPECHVEWTESSVRRQRLGSIELISPVTHKWFSDSRNYIPILSGITVKTFKGLKECKLFFPFPFHAIGLFGTTEHKKNVLSQDLRVKITQNQGADFNILSFLQNNRTNQILQFLGHQSNFNRSLTFKDTFCFNRETFKKQFWYSGVIPKGGTTYKKSGTWPKKTPLPIPRSKLESEGFAQHSALKSSQNFYTWIDTLEILKKKSNKNSLFYSVRTKKNPSFLEDFGVNSGESEGLGPLQTWPYVQTPIDPNNLGSDKQSRLPPGSQRNQHFTSPLGQNSWSLGHLGAQGSWVLPSTAPPETNGGSASQEGDTSWSQRHGSIKELGDGVASRLGPAWSQRDQGHQSRHQDQLEAKTLSTRHYTPRNEKKVNDTNSLLEFKTTSSRVKKSTQKKIARYRFLALNKTKMTNLAFLESTSLYTMPVLKNQTNPLFREKIRGVSEKSPLSFSQSPALPLHFEYIFTLSDKNNGVFKLQSLKTKGKPQFLKNFKPVQGFKHDPLLLKQGNNKTHSIITLWPKKQNIVTTLKKFYGLAFKWSKTNPTSLTELSQTKSESIAWTWFARRQIADFGDSVLLGSAWPARARLQRSQVHAKQAKKSPRACEASKEVATKGQATNTKWHSPAQGSSLETSLPFDPFAASFRKSQKGPSKLQNFPISNSNWEFDYLPTILLIEKAKRIDYILTTVRGQIDIIKKFKYLGEFKILPERIGSLPYGYNPPVKPLVSVIPPWSPKSQSLVAVSPVRRFRRSPFSGLRIGPTDLKNHDGPDLVPSLRPKLSPSQQASTTSSFVQSAAVNTIAVLKALRITNLQLTAVVENQSSLLCGNLNQTFKNLENRQFDEKSISLSSTCDLVASSVVPKGPTQAAPTLPYFRSKDLIIKSKQEPFGPFGTKITPSARQENNSSFLNSNLTSNLFQKSSKVVPFEITDVIDQRPLSRNLWSQRDGDPRAFIIKKGTNWYKHHCFPIRPSFTQPEDYRRQFIRFLGGHGLIGQGDTPIFKYITQNSDFNNYKKKKGLTKKISNGLAPLWFQGVATLVAQRAKPSQEAQVHLKERSNNLNREKISAFFVNNKLWTGTLLAVRGKERTGLATSSETPPPFAPVGTPETSDLGQSACASQGARQSGPVHSNGQAKPQALATGHNLDQGLAPCLRSPAQAHESVLSVASKAWLGPSYAQDYQSRQQSPQVQAGPPMEVYFSEAKSFAKEDRVKHILTQTGGGALQHFLELTNLNHCVLLLQNDLFEIAPRLDRSQSARRVLLQILNDTFNELNQTNRLLEKKKILFGTSGTPSNPDPGLALDLFSAKGTTEAFGLSTKVDTNTSGVVSPEEIGVGDALLAQGVMTSGQSLRKATLSPSNTSTKSEKGTQDKYKTYYRSKIERLEKKYKDLKKEYKAVKKICTDFQNRKNVQKRRYKLAFQLLRTLSNPAGMTLSSVPVLPPGLRPIIDVPKIGPITADLNIRYRGLIFALRNLRELAYVDFRNTGAAQASVQEAVDDLLYTGGKTRKDKAVDRSPNLYKSLAMRLKGKHGRFRGNLLGKRVDYSGRSVIVVGPTLKIHQCGLPFEIATKLFNPFLIRRLIQKGLCKNVYKAKQILISGKFKPLIWTLCREVMLEHLVLLNRAPTLHRLGVQAFMPILISGRAILLHPLVCTGFNADFDGDQMGVHIPLFPKARAEAWKMMWSRNNFLAPSSGEPILLPSQDMVLGCYYLTEMCLGIKPSPFFRNFYKNRKNRIMVSQKAHTLVDYASSCEAPPSNIEGTKKDVSSYKVSRNNRGPYSLLRSKALLSTGALGASEAKGQRPVLLGAFGSTKAPLVPKGPSPLGHQSRHQPPLGKVTTWPQRGHAGLCKPGQVEVNHAGGFNVLSGQDQNIPSMPIEGFRPKGLSDHLVAEPKILAWSWWRESPQVLLSTGARPRTHSPGITGINHPNVFLDAYNRGILNLQSIVWVNSYKIKDIYQSTQTQPSTNDSEFSSSSNGKLDGDGTLVSTLELRVTPYGLTQLLQTVGTKKGFFLNLTLVPLKKNIKTPFENASVRTTVGRLLFNNVLQKVDRNN